MKKVLIIYGYYHGWKNICDTNNLMLHLNNLLYDVKQIISIEELKEYLQGDGQKYKNYILPLRIHHIHELNKAGINFLFDIKSENLKFLETKNMFANYIYQNNLTDFVPTYYNKSSNRTGKQLVILKPHDSALSYGIYKKKICEVEDWEFDHNVVQEYIYDSKEYAGYFVSYYGNIIHAFAYVGDYGNNEYIKCEGGKKDETPQSRINIDNELKCIFEKILKPCLYTGACCFDYKIINDRIYIFEINPRLGGSLNIPKNIADLIDIIRKLIEIYDHRNVYN